MTDQRLCVTVTPDGCAQARWQANNAHSPEGKVGFTDLDADVIRLFERWLTLRDRTWRDDEIQVFGSLLHRCLFTDRVWSWIESRINAPSTDADHRIRLELCFPAKPPYSRLAAVPWEYLLPAIEKLAATVTSSLPTAAHSALPGAFRSKTGEPHFTPLDDLPRGASSSPSRKIRDWVRSSPMTTYSPRSKGVGEEKISAPPRWSATPRRLSSRRLWPQPTAGVRT